MGDKKPLQIYLTADERAAIDKAAKAISLSTSQYIKLKALDKLTVGENKKQLKFNFGGDK